MPILGQLFQRTSKLTVAPVTIFAPGAGFCDTMTLAGAGCGGGAGGNVAAAEKSAAGTGGDGTDGAMLTLPNRNPASCNTKVTPPKAWPVKLGIRNACGGADSVVSRLILGAAIPLAFG